MPDEVVQTITASETAEECKARWPSTWTVGRLPGAYPLGRTWHAMIDVFVDWTA